MSRAVAIGTRPLLLGVKRKEWRGDGRLQEDKVYQAARAAALDRDRRTCLYCGWQAEKYQEAHHVDDDHNHNDPSNLATACAWCHGAHHIGRLGELGLAVLGVHPEHPRKQLPEQWRLNHLFRTLLAMEGDHQIDARAELTDWFLNECAEAAEYWLETADPAELGGFLLTLSDREYAERGAWLSGVRLIPFLSVPMIDQDDPAYQAWQLELARRQYWADQIRARYGHDWSRLAA